MRPLDRFSSIKIKLGILVTATVTLAALFTWIGLYNHLGPTRTLPLAIVVSVIAVQVLAHGMTARVRELRTPVAALRAQLENMVDGVVDPDPASLQAALDQTERLGRLVTYLLDLSRIQAGAVGLDIADVPLAEFLEEAAVAARPIGAQKGVAIRVAVDPPDLTVPADAERLHQVVANLLHNAVRHSPAEAEVRLEARRSGPWVVIDVTDKGPGIAPADRQRVFQRFTRGNAPTQTGRESTGGTGLGPV